ncbi:MAG: enoyl-CoA hydratase/isomerase family protein [Methanobacteriota archaeon]|nr:MAG: enoyl-CoA hydratase/isomerase family protein [Euryarchaeota archaeon]
MSDIVATREEGVLILELASKSNTFTYSLLETLEMWLQQAENDHSLHAIIITGRGKMFSAGGDLNEMLSEIEAGRKAGYVRNIVPLVNRVIRLILSHPLPIIVALNGSVAGGAISILLAADHRVAVSKAKIAFAFGSLSLTPDSGTSVLVPYFLGVNFSTAAFSKAEIHSVNDLAPNLFDEIVESKEELLVVARKIADTYKNVDRWVFWKTKSLVRSPLIERFDKQSELELKMIQTACERDQFEIKLRKMIDRLAT